MSQDYTGPARDQGALMNQIYRRQRFIYNATRKYYLLGRDRMLRDLAVPPGGTVLEIGCGTGRNLIALAKLHPTAQLYGIDISTEMLETARTNATRAGVGHRIAFGLGDATRLDPGTSFGHAAFDRVFFSYSLSMIPDWAGALDQAIHVLRPTGQAHVVDFGAAEGLPHWFRRLMTLWLRLFHVTPRAGLDHMLDNLSAKTGAAVECRPAYRGYAVLARIHSPSLAGLAGSGRPSASVVVPGQAA
jgi:S-adenosylmethionine-diacylgycerolhomoserine-N-methlytransferase